MTALCCIDTQEGRIRRYIPQVNAGVRRARSTGEFQIVRPQLDSLPREIEMIRQNKTAHIPTEALTGNVA